MGAALSIFPALAEMQARSKLMNAQAGQVGQDARFQQQKYGDEQSVAAALGNMGGPVGVPVPGGQPLPTPPQPGEASQPSAAGFRPFSPPPAAIRVPQPSGPAMGGPLNQDPLTAGTPEPGGAVDRMLPQAAQPPAPAAQPATGAHKWAAQPGEQFDTPDGSRPRSLQEVVAALRKANPKASNEVLGRAAMAYLPWLTEEDQARLREETLRTNTLIAEGNRDAAMARVKEQQAGQTARTDATIASKEKIAYATLDLRGKLAAARDDVRYKELAAKSDNWAAKLDLAKKQFDQTQSQDSATNYFKALAAQHDADYNLISTMFANGDMTEEEKAAAQAQVDATRDEAAAAVSRFAKPTAKVAAPTAKGKAVKSIRVPGAVAPIGPSPSGFQ